MKYKMYFILSILLVISTFSCKKSKNAETDSVPVATSAQAEDTVHKPSDNALYPEYRQLAQADIKSGTMKYYNFGQLPPDSAWMARFKKYKVKVIMKNCVIQPELSAYNEVVIRHIEDLEKL